MDYLEIRKLWEDEAEKFMRWKVTAACPDVTAAVELYVTDAQALDLGAQLGDFLKGGTAFSWSAGAGDGRISLGFRRRDVLGHLCVEIGMEQEPDGNRDGYRCSFSLWTEIGLLDTFWKRLPGLGYGAGWTALRLGGEEEEP